MNPLPEARTPGQLIQNLLDEKGWSQIVLGIIVDMDKSAINRLVAGVKGIDAGTALLLEKAFGVPAERFLDLQKSYDLARARLSVRHDPNRETRAHLFGELPVSEMIKRGWLGDADIRDVPKTEKALMKFFGASSLEEIEFLPHAAKKTDVATAPTPTQLAWLYRIKEIAADMIVGRYSNSSGREAVEKLSALLSAAEEARKVPRILAECGIRFVIVESLKSAKIDGVCFWLNEFSPVVGLSLRYDRIDNFWFVLRHEMEHVLRQHGLTTTVMLDAELEGERAGTGPSVADDEREANQAAANFCVPRSKLDRFVERKSPFFAERDILGFARTLGVHPGLIAGQLQHQTGRFDRFRNHLVKIRSSVAPSAIVDGWGDVAPVEI